MLQHMRREGEATLEHVQASVGLATEHGFPYLTAWGPSCRGGGWRVEGRSHEGLAQMRQGLGAFRATGAELLCPYLLALLADAYGCGGQIEAGLGALEEALRAAEQHEERFYEAELHRLKGELLLRQGGGVEGQPCPARKPARPCRHWWGSSAGAPQQREADACFQRARRPRPASEGKVAGAAGGPEPRIGCGSSRASVPQPMRCW